MACLFTVRPVLQSVRKWCMVSRYSKEALACLHCCKDLARERKRRVCGEESRDCVLGTAASGIESCSMLYGRRRDLRCRVVLSANRRPEVFSQLPSFADVHQSITDLNGKIESLERVARDSSGGSSGQSLQHYTAMTDMLKARLLDVTKEFKDVLLLRTEVGLQK